VNKLSASHIYAWKLGLKTGQYYLRSRPARDAIQFTLDVDNLESNVTKNKTKAEMDTDRRMTRKRALKEVTPSEPKVPESLNKKRKTTDPSDEIDLTAKPQAVKEAEKAPESGKTEEKPWEGKKEEEEDYRWNICENCQ
jgi:ribonucleotide reductase alpha subunit